MDAVRPRLVLCTEFLGLEVPECGFGRVRLAELPPAFGRGRAEPVWLAPVHLALPVELELELS